MFKVLQPCLHLLAIATSLFALGVTSATAKPTYSNSAAIEPICYMQNQNGLLSDLSGLCQQDARQQASALQQLLTTRQCSGCHLPGVNLVGAKLREANLSQADLSRSRLNNAFLPFSDFSGAKLNQANLTGANLTGANLTGANLSGANLSGADLSGASLDGANLTQTVMPDGTVHP